MQPRQGQKGKAMMTPVAAAKPQGDRKAPLGLETPSDQACLPPSLLPWPCLSRSKAEPLWPLVGCRAGQRGQDLRQAT